MNSLPLSHLVILLSQLVYKAYERTEEMFLIRNILIRGKSKSIKGDQNLKILKIKTYLAFPPRKWF